MIKRIFCMLFALVMCLGILVSCKKDVEEPVNSDSGNTTVSTETPNVEDTKVPLKVLPEKNYNGYKFTVLSRTAEMHRGEFFVDEASEDIVDRAVWDRNAMVEERYGIEIVEANFSQGSDGHMADPAVTELSTGVSSYDLIAPHGRYATAYAVAGYCVDWYTLPYQNLTYDWWSQGARECFTINGRAYLMTGDLSHQSSAASYCVMFNKKLLRDEGIAMPYDDVRNGTWTFDKMATIAVDLASDGGDGSFSLESDRYGYMTFPWGGTYCAFFASGGRVLTTDATGMPILSLYTDTTYNALTAFFNLVNNEACYQDKSDGNAKVITAIQDGRFVFFDCPLGDIPQNFGEADIEYGIVPYPKTDSNMTTYVSHTAGSRSLFIIPYTASDLERTSVILETLAQTGRDRVLPEFYDKVVSLQTADSADDYEMIKLIAKCRIYDLGYYYTDIGPVGSVMKELAVENYEKGTGATVFASKYQNGLSGAQEGIEKLLIAHSS